jgi:DNA repair protein RadD
MQNTLLNLPEPRWYQTEATNAVMDLLAKNDINIHPVVVAPTASGKSLMICDLIDQYITQNIDAKVLVLSHVKEILDQDFEALNDYFSGSGVGLYSAGLGFRDVDQITVAGIQSVHNKPELFKDVKLIIIDECHLVTIRGTGMYRKFLSKMKANYVGFTATHFRLGHGYIHKGEGALFTDIAYDMSKPEIFNRLVHEGYLCKLIARATDMRFDAEGIKLIAQDYSVKELSLEFDRDEITEVAVKEIVKYGHNYKKWLVFAIDIKHAVHITEAFKRLGINAACVHSKMKDSDRDRIIEAYRSGKYRAVVNVDILTTGLNVPDIDLIALLRPTKSPVFHVQSIGRGLRVFLGKNHTLVLDFAQNISRLGPINDVVVKQKEKGKKGQPIIKECPSCQALIAPAVRICPVCGYEFKFKTHLTAKPGTDDIVKKTEINIAKWHDVKNVKYRIHKRVGKPDILLVKYTVGIQTISEWICYDYEGYPKYSADNWVRFRSPEGMPKPENVAQLFEWSEWLKQPKKIFTNMGDKFPKITSVVFE